MQPGPRTREQLARLKATWRQGEHVLISGGTGSGKTALARHIDQVRLERQGHVIVFVTKLVPDETILDDYKGWTRWKEWRKNPSPHDTRILLWPDVRKGKTIREKRAMQRAVFGDAMDKLIDRGKWTVHFDEGLYMCDPEFLNLKSEVAMLHTQGRSAKLTLVTLVQRPSNIPLVVYGSISHAYMGRTREQSDVKRLAEMGGRESAKELASRIDSQGRHDFLWIPVAPDWQAESVNLRR